MDQGRVGERGSGRGVHVEVPCSIRFAPFRLELANERLWRGDEPIALKPKAFAILSYLLQHPQRIVTKAELLEHLWDGVHVNDAVLKTHLREIRRALGDDVRAPRYIETAHRRGYRFIAPSVVVSAAAPSDMKAPESMSQPVANGPAGSLPSADSPRRVAPAVFAGSATGDGAVEPLLAAFAPSPHFVGRQAELEWLELAREQAGLGHRQVVLVNGSAGIGKTSLVRAFTSRLSQRGAAPAWAQVAWGQCVEQCGSDEPYLPLIEALSRLGRGRDRRLWLDHLSRYAPGWIARMPVFHTDPAGSSNGSGRELRGSSAPSAEHLLYQLTDALESFSQREPLLLVLEDIQWADASTLAWLAYLARRNDLARLLVVCTFRPLEASRGQHPLGALKRTLERQSSRSELKLPCLLAADVKAYVAARFPDAELPSELFALLHDRTAGHPLFMARVLDNWVERGLLSPRANGRSSLADVRAELERETPESVLSLIEQEYEQLTEFECSVIEAASVAGHQFSAASVAAALSAELLAVEDVCVRWAKHGQFFQLAGKESWPDGTLSTRLAFIHGLYRDTAYSRLGAARQTLLHLGIARGKERAYREHSVEIATELAHHFECARDYRRAALHLCTAGERALATSAFAEAGEYFEKGLGLIEHLPHGVHRARLEIRLQVGAAALLTATRAQAREKERAARTATAIGRRFLAAAHAREDEGAVLRATLLLGMAEACLGDLPSARSRLEYAIGRHPVQHRRPLEAATPALEVGAALEMAPPLEVAPSALAVPYVASPEQGRSPALARGEAGEVAPAGGAMALSTKLVHSHGAVLALTWRAMLRSFLGETAANDRDPTFSAACDEPGERSWGESVDCATLGASAGACPDGALEREPNVAMRWVEGLLREALAEVDSWFGDAATAQNDLESFEPRHGYWVERRAVEGARWGSPAVPRD